MFNWIPNWARINKLKEDVFIRDKEISIRDQRIKDLERTLEQSLGRNQVLEESLQRAQQKEDSLLQKIFELTGVNKRVGTPVDATTPAPNKAIDFIKMARTGKSWDKVRQEIETNARTQAWEQRAEEERVKKEIWDKEQAAKENKVFINGNIEGSLGRGELDADKIS